jgi:hypothetical protein
MSLYIARMTMLMTETEMVRFTMLPTPHRRAGHHEGALILVVDESQHQSTQKNLLSLHLHLHLHLHLQQQQ